MVEKQVMLHTGRFLVPSEDDVEVRYLKPTVVDGSASGSSGIIQWTVSSFADTANATSPCAVICIKGDVDEEMEAKYSRELPNLLNHALSVRVFYRPSAALSCTYTTWT